MTIDQLNNLIDVFNRVVSTPTEILEEGDKAIEVVTIPHDDWEIFSMMINHQYTETVKMGGYEYERRCWGQISSYHDKNGTVHKWVINHETLRAIAITLESLQTRNCYKNVKYEDLFEDWNIVIKEK